MPHGIEDVTPFEPDGVYNSVPYRVLPDCSIEAMMPGGLVKFKDMEQLIASSGGVPTNSQGPQSVTLATVGGRNGNAPAVPIDYYSILTQAIKAAKQNSTQLRALVFERARFNLKRDFLFGYSSMGLADVVQHVNEFELAVARIEANATDDPPEPVYRQPVYRRQLEQADSSDTTPGSAVQILPPKPVPPIYEGPRTIHRTENFQLARLTEEFARHARYANKFIAISLLAVAFVGTVIITMLWPVRVQKASLPVEIAETPSSPVVASAAIGHPITEKVAPDEATPKLPFPVPSSFGIYALSDNKLTELQPLPISIPDPRVALSAEIVKPSPTSISDSKPAFILFRRDLLNSVPQKITLRVVARVARETKVVAGKVQSTPIEDAWRVRDISRELKISPIAGQREMVMARLDDDVTLAAGRYALVLNRTGYDFTISAGASAAASCLEQFEAANGTVFNQCRAP